jgi:uncharacterized tellurite resistance protein B-like protein
MGRFCILYKDLRQSRSACRRPYRRVSTAGHPRDGILRYRVELFVSRPTWPLAIVREGYTNFDGAADMSWQAIVGGVIGGVFGGPLGAAAGAAIGAGIGTLDEDGSPLQNGLPGELRFFSDADGVLLVLSLPSVPEGALIVVHGRYENGSYRKSSVANYQDGDGDFQLVRSSLDRGAILYLPHGVVPPDSDDTVQLSFRAVLPSEDGEHEVIGESSYTIDYPHKPYSNTRIWRPLIGLCMTVARADGSLDRSEVRVIRKILLEGLEIPASEVDTIKLLMREEPSDTVENLITKLFQRFPTIEPPHVLTCLADVAKADGTIHPTEVLVIKEAATHLGCNEEDWSEVMAMLGLGLPETDLLAHRELLEVGPDATAREIKRAYTRKAKEYHPDRHQNLPKEFQELAKTMMMRLTEARNALLKTV